MRSCSSIPAFCSVLDVGRVDPTNPWNESAPRRGLQRLDADIPEPDGLALGLQRDMSKRELQGRAGIQQRLGVRVAGIELWMLVAQHLDAIDAVDDFVVATHLDFGRHPLAGREELRA